MEEEGGRGARERGLILQSMCRLHTAPCLLKTIRRERVGKRRRKDRGATEESGSTEEKKFYTGARASILGYPLGLVQRLVGAREEKKRGAEE
jgi:hypothetical protein